MRLLVGEVEDLVEHLLLDGLELTHVLGRGDGMPDVLACVRDHPRGRRFHPQQPEHGIRRVLEQPDDRVRDLGEDVERDREGNRDRLGFLKRDRFRDELAERHRQVGQDEERDHERHAARQEVEVARDQRLADGTERDAEDGDPDLHRRDEPHGIVHQPQRGARRAVPACCAPLEAVPARGDQRVLRRDEHCVAEHQEQDENEAPGVAHR